MKLLKVNLTTEEKNASRKQQNTTELPELLYPLHPCDKRGLWFVTGINDYGNNEMVCSGWYSLAKTRTDGVRLEQGKHHHSKFHPIFVRPVVCFFFFEPANHFRSLIVTHAVPIGTRIITRYHYGLYDNERRKRRSLLRLNRKNAYNTPAAAYALPYFWPRGSEKNMIAMRDAFCKPTTGGSNSGDVFGCFPHWYWPGIRDTRETNIITFADNEL